MARKRENPSTCKFIAPRRKMLWSLFILMNNTVKHRKTPHRSLCLPSICSPEYARMRSHIFPSLPPRCVSEKSVMLRYLVSTCKSHVCHALSRSALSPFAETRCPRSVFGLDSNVPVSIYRLEVPPPPQQEFTSQETPRSWGRWRKTCGGNLERRVTRREEMVKRVGLSSC